MTYEDKGSCESSPPCNTGCMAVGISRTEYMAVGRRYVAPLCYSIIIQIYYVTALSQQHYHIDILCYSTVTQALMLQHCRPEVTALSYRYITLQHCHIDILYYSTVTQALMLQHCHIGTSPLSYCHVFSTVACLELQYCHIFSTVVCLELMLQHKFEARNMGWLRLVGSIKLQVSFAEYCLFYRVLLQKRPII